MCVSENVALIGGSVAVMRYQPPANKRINIKRRRWVRRRKKVARGSERVKRSAIENVREGEEEEKEEKFGVSTKLEKKSRAAEGSQRLGRPIQCFD